MEIEYESERTWDANQIAVFSKDELLDYITMLPHDAKIIITTDGYYECRFDDCLIDKPNEDGRYILASVVSRP